MWNVHGEPRRSAATQYSLIRPRGRIKFNFFFVYQQLRNNNRGTTIDKYHKDKFSHDAIPVAIDNGPENVAKINKNRKLNNF